MLALEQRCKDDTGLVYTFFLEFGEFFEIPYANILGHNSLHDSHDLCHFKVLSMAQIPCLPAKKKVYLRIFWTFDLCADPFGWLGVGCLGCKPQ